MTVTAAALRDLHRIHRQLTDLRERLDRGPRQIKARQAGLNKLNEELLAARDAHIQAQKINDSKQLDLKTGEQRIVDLGVKLNSASSNKEYQTLLEQIEASKMAGSVLSDEILEGFDTVDELAKGVQQSQEHVAAGEAELKQTTTAVESSAESIRTDIARLGEELVGAEATLPSDLKPDYVRVVQKKRRRGIGRTRRRCLHRLWKADHTEHAQRATAFEARVLQVVRLPALFARIVATMLLTCSEN